MTMFLILAGMLLLTSLAAVVWPLWRDGPAGGSRRQANIAVYEQHANQVQQDAAAGRITHTDAQSRRDELGARLLEDMAAEPTRTDDTIRRRPWTSSAVVVVGIAVLVIGLYGMLGDPRGLQPQPDIGALVSRMEARLADVPGDLRTRSRLAQVQMAQRNYTAAARALAALNQRLDTPDVMFLLAEARARVRSHDGTVTDRAQALYEQVLTLAPTNPEALWFAGLAALAGGNRQRAVSLWQTLLDQQIPTDFRTRVEQRLAEFQDPPASLARGE